MSKSLEMDIFRLIVKSTPLISIDLIIYNNKNQVLLGLRKNRPAMNYWFAPGGRIMKDETIRVAFKRIALAETGVPVSTEQAKFLGVYEHLYPEDNFFGETDFGTHYVVMAFEVKQPDIAKDLPKEQHDIYKWFTVDELLSDPHVHLNVKNYFNGSKPY